MFRISTHAATPPKSPVAPREFQRGLAWSTRARCPPCTRTQACADARHAHMHRWHPVIRSARVRERLTRCLGKFSLDDVYGHHIHQSDLHPIHYRREKCWSICYTLPNRFTPDQTDSVSLLLLLLLFLALVCYFGSAHSLKHAHESLRQCRRVLHCYHRGSMHSNEPSGSGANVPLVKCVAAQRDGKDASRSCLYADTLPLPSGRRLKVTMIAALGGPERSFRCAAEEVQYSKRGTTSCSFQRKGRDGDNSEVRF